MSANESGNAFQRLILDVLSTSGLSYREVAERCALSRSQIQSLARNPRKHVPSPTVLAELAKGLGVSLRDLEKAAAETWLRESDPSPIRTYPRGWDELAPEDQRNIQRQIDRLREIHGNNGG